MQGMEEMRLNEEQRRAVEHADGPLLIVAGAGTGKTRVITRRIARLIQEGVSAENILALTFSNKAAAEMAERVERIAGESFGELWIGTFHSFCADLLRRYGLLAGVDPFFTILTEAQQHLLLESRIDELGLRHYAVRGRANGLVSALLTAFSRAKDEMISAKEYLAFAEGERKRLEQAQLGEDERLEAEEEVGRLGEVAGAYDLYERLLVEHGAYDFGSLILETIRMLAEHPAILGQVRAQFTHVLVDEFQDTNFAQSVLVDMLVEEHRNVCVVGDDDQSIYRFRGASIKNILDFQSKYPEALVARLQDNYRSGQQVLDASHALVSKNVARLEKRLRAQNSESLVEAFVTGTVEEEAAEIAERAGRVIEGGTPPEEIAVLLRSVRGQGAPIVKAFERAQIPYDLVDGSLLTDQAEVRDAVAWLKAVDNPFDGEAMTRLLSAPPVDMDPIELCRITNWARERRHSVFEAASSPEKVPGLDKKAAEQAERATETLRKLARRAPRATAEAMVHETLGRSGYRLRLARMGPEGVLPLANLSQLERMASEFGGLGGAGLRAFIEYLGVIAEAGLREKGVRAGSGGVQIMTMHAAKGLEFEAVFMAGLAQSKIPGRRRPAAIEIPEGLLKEQLPEPDLREAHVAEERRLFYVAMTRAKRRLVMSYALGDSERGAKPSQFLREAAEVGIEVARLERPEPALEVFDEEGTGSSASDISYLQFLQLTEDAGLSLSYSDIDCYRNCPMQFKLSRVYRIPGKPSPERGFGTLVHSVLEQFHRTCPKPEASFKRLEALFDQAWKAQRFGENTRERQFRQKALEGLEAYCADFCGCEAEPAYFERDFNLKVGAHMIRGRVDRVDLLPAGGHELIDYKVGRTWDEKRVREDLQLSVYHMGAASVWGIHPAELTYYFILENKKMSLSRSEQELNEAREIILEAADRILAEDFEPVEGFISCRYCDYTLVCPAKDR